MANEVTFAYQSGKNIYYVVKNNIGQFYNTTIGSFESINSANWSTKYGIAMAENVTGQYFASFPTPQILAGAYSIDIYLRAGTSPALSDGPPIGLGAIQWSGTREISLYDLSIVPAIFGNVTASPTPTSTVFNIILTLPVSASAVASSFVNQFVTCMPGGANGAAAYAKISACTVTNVNNLLITLASPLPVIPSTNDPVAISG